MAGFTLAGIPTSTATGADTATVTGVASRSGQVAGGQKVTLVGTHLGTVTGVLFGSVHATTWTVASDGRLTVTTPAHGAGRTYVRVTTSSYGTSPLSETATYIYLARPAALAYAGASHTHSDLDLAEVSCASPTWCGASGYDFVEPSGFGFDAGEVYNGRSWGPQHKFGGDSFSPDSGEVSCVVTPTKLCQFGTWTGIVYRTTDGTTYTSTDLHVADVNGGHAALPRLSCATSSFCKAVAGAYAWTWNGTTWGAAEHVLGADGRATGGLADISCPTTSFCQAVLSGSPARVIRFQGGTWGQVETIPTTSAGAGTNTITCSSASYCLAGTSEGFVAWTGLAWSPPESTAVSNSDQAGTPTLQCLSPTTCVRDVHQGFQTFNGSPHARGKISPLSCWAAYQCLVVGADSSYVTKKGAA